MEVSKIAVLIFNAVNIIRRYELSMKVCMYRGEKGKVDEIRKIFIYFFKVSNFYTPSLRCVNLEQKAGGDEQKRK